MAGKGSADTRSPNYALREKNIGKITQKCSKCKKGRAPYGVNNSLCNKCEKKHESAL